MAYSDFTDPEIVIGNANKKSLWQKVKDNFTNHESRIVALANAANKIILFDTVVDLAAIPRAGEIRQYLLTNTQINNILANDGWDYMAGADITGTTLAALYGNTLPDGRDRFLRNLAASGKTVGQTEANQNLSHDHQQSLANPSIGQESQFLSYNGSPPVPLDCGIYVGPNNSFPAGSAGITPITTQLDGNSEARPDSIIINNTIKFGEDFSRLLVSRIPSNLNIVSATISNIGAAGSSGTLEIDLLKGSSLGSLSSILNSNISLDYTAGANATSNEGSFSTSLISQNDFLVVDLKSIQATMTKFFVSVYAEPA